MSKGCIIPAAPGTEAVVWYDHEDGGWSETLDVIAWFIPEVDDNYGTNPYPILCEEIPNNATVGVIQKSGRVIVPRDCTYESVAAFLADRRSKTTATC